MKTDSHNDFQNPSIGDIAESDLVRTLMGDPHWKGRLTHIHGVPDGVEHRLEVPLIGLPSDPKGDIDIMLTKPSQPEDATAIQVKRVKVGEDAFLTGQPNKLREFEKGIAQANLLAKIGFCRVYLYVLIVVDSRSQNIGKYSYAGLSQELGSTINSALSPRALAERVGFIKFDFTQPMDYPPLSTGAYGGNLVRLAQTTIQPSAVTAWVRAIIDDA